MKCPKCEKENVNNINACEFCGSEMFEAIDAQPVETKEEAPKKKSKKKLVVAIVAIVLVAIAAVVALLLINDNNADNYQAPSVQSTNAIREPRPFSEAFEDLKNYVLKNGTFYGTEFGIRYQNDAQVQKYIFTDGETITIHSVETMTDGSLVLDFVHSITIYPEDMYQDMFAYTVTYDGYSGGTWMYKEKYIGVLETDVFTLDNNTVDIVAKYKSDYYTEPTEQEITQEDIDDIGVQVRNVLVDAFNYITEETDLNVRLADFGIVG